jgi:hypothetical protein
MKKPRMFQASPSTDKSDTEDGEVKREQNVNVCDSSSYDNWKGDNLTNHFIRQSNPKKNKKFDIKFNAMIKMLGKIRYCMKQIAYRAMNNFYGTLEVSWPGGIGITGCV